MPFSLHVNRQLSPLHNLPDEALREICLSLQEAIEIDMPENRSQLNWKVHNGMGIFAWNQIYTCLLRNRNLRTFHSKSWGWGMAFAYHPETEFLIGFMREQRFAELQAKQSSRARMHYVDALARSLNANESVKEPQISLFRKQFADEERLRERVSKLLQEYDFENGCLSHFALVLIEDRGNQILNLRIVLVDPDLNVVAERKLNSLLSHEVLPIVETVPTSEVPAQNPERNLRLTMKAQQRKKNGLRKKLPKKLPKKLDDSDNTKA